MENFNEEDCIPCHCPDHRTMICDKGFYVKFTPDWVRAFITHLVLAYAQAVDLKTFTSLKKISLLTVGGGTSVHLDEIQDWGDVDVSVFISDLQTPTSSL